MKDTFYLVTVIARPMGWKVLSPRAWLRGRDVAEGLQAILKQRMEGLADARRVPYVGRRGPEISH